VVGVAHGPSYFAAKGAYDDAQREVDDAVRFHRPQYEVKDAERKRDAAKEHLDKVERTGE